VASLCLMRRAPARNRQRFYAITVPRTRFGGWALVREWGRIGQPGTVREAWFETEGAARAAGEQWRERREKRGYRAVVG
jgi:predicted DNA-binding WGR domain protein